MDSSRVWVDFQQKLMAGSFSSGDCIHHSPFDYSALLCSREAEPLRRLILAETRPKVERGEEKLIFTIPMGEGNELRVDFKCDGGLWKLYLLDGLTIPLSLLPQLPLTEFVPYSFENRMRMEDVVTRRVYLYLKIRDRIGKTEALSWFRDGQGFRLNVESWMPYFTLRKAFVLFVAWRENRYWGQRMAVEELSDDRARLVFKDHEEMMIYGIAGHLKPRIPLAEYREVFEDPWHDRAETAGWHLKTQYEGNDTIFNLNSNAKG
jgi:hypothetical protein